MRRRKQRQGFIWVCVRKVHIFYFSSQISLQADEIGVFYTCLKVHLFKKNQASKYNTCK